MGSRLAGALAVTLLSFSLSAQQFHGPGASLTTSSPKTGAGVDSFGNRSGFTFGTPPSLTSITPGPARRFGVPIDGRRRHHGGHGHGKNFVPIYVPFYSYPYYPYAYSDLYTDTAVPDNMDQQQPEDFSPPALTVFENRPGCRPPAPQPAESRDYASAESNRTSADRGTDTQPAPEPSPVTAQAPTVLVFRDGRQLEIGNYAIQGDVLYNLDGNGPRKIKLADLDLAKTVEANDARGNEFRLPKSYRG
jgi:hypothetical protein